MKWLNVHTSLSLDVADGIVGHPSAEKYGPYFLLIGRIAEVETSIDNDF